VPVDTKVHTREQIHTQIRCAPSPKLLPGRKAIRNPSTSKKSPMSYELEPPSFLKQKKKIQNSINKNEIQKVTQNDQFLSV
jgi:hypothetical protein